MDVEDDENKTGNNDKKFLSPDSRTKKKNKDSLNFSMRYSRYLTKTNSPVFKNMVEESDIFGLQEDLKINDDSVNALKSLILCHNAKTLIREGNTLKFYHTNDEFEIIKFCTNIGYKFERIGKFPNKMEYMININGKEIKYDVLGVIRAIEVIFVLLVALFVILLFFKISVLMLAIICVEVKFSRPAPSKFNPPVVDASFRKLSN